MLVFDARAAGGDSVLDTALSTILVPGAARYGKGQMRAEMATNRAPQPPDGITSYVAGTIATPFSPTGRLRISAHDMGQVMLMLMNEGVHHGRRLLKPATIAGMHR